MLLAGSSGVALASRALCSATPIGCASLARFGRPANASAAQLAAGRPAKSPPTAAVPRNFRRCIVISLSPFAALTQPVGDLRAPARLDRKTDGEVTSLDVRLDPSGSRTLK